MKPWIATILTLALAMPASASSPAERYEIGPWRIGMSAGQVKSFKEFGPYRTDEESGGIETRNGSSDGKRRLTSFSFDNDALSTIQVWKYEGSDPAAAKEAILDVYRSFAKRLGGATVDGVDVNGKRELPEEALKAVLDSTIDGTIKAAADFRKENPGAVVAATFDMRPVRQPSGSQLTLRWRYSSKYDSLYVVLYQDRAGAAIRKVESAIEVSAD